MSSSGASATITAIAVFKNGCEGMSYIFDAQIYFGKSTPILAALRYFNCEGCEFSDIGFYFITASVGPDFLNLCLKGSYCYY